MASRWSAFVDRFYRDDRFRLAVTLGVCVLLLGGAYLVLVEWPARRAEHYEKQQWQQMELKAKRMASPPVDPALIERNVAWDEIIRKQRDPDYDIPLDKVRLIRKRWPEITSGMTPEEVEKLKQQLEF